MIYNKTVQSFNKAVKQNNKALQKLSEGDSMVERLITEIRFYVDGSKIKVAVKYRLRDNPQNLKEVNIPVEADTLKTNTMNIVDEVNKILDKAGIQ